MNTGRLVFRYLLRPGNIYEIMLLWQVGNKTTYACVPADGRDCSHLVRKAGGCLTGCGNLDSFPREAFGSPLPTQRAAPLHEFLQTLHGRIGEAAVNKKM
jgi:hypothetical protein